MLDIFWRKSLALTVFENIRVAIPIAKIETRQLVTVFLKRSSKNKLTIFLDVK